MAVFEKATFFNVWVNVLYTIITKSFFTKQTGTYKNNAYLSSETKGTVIQYFFVFENTYTLPWSTFVHAIISKMDDY